MTPRHKNPGGWMQLGVLLAALWIGLTWSISRNLLWAAEPAKSPPPAGETKPAPAQPVAISASEVIPRSEQALRSLQETRFELAADSDPALTTLQKEISEFAEKSDKRWQNAAEILGASRSLQRINDALREWSIDQSQLDRWDRALARRSQILVAEEDDVRRISEIWEVTREAGKQQGFPKVALQKVTDVLREADAVRGLIRGAMAKLLGLQIQLANRRDILGKIHSDIERAREESGRQLFVLDSVPLWQASFSAESQEVIETEAIRSLQRFTEDVRDFGTKYAGRILWQGVFLAALVLLFSILRREPPAQAIEQLGGAGRFVLDRFLLSSFLLALLTVPLFYPGASSAVLRIALLPAVLPAIILLPRLLPRYIRRAVHWLVAMYVVNFLRYLLPADWLFTRLLLLAIAAGGCIGLGLFLRARAAELSASGFSDRLILLVARVVALLFGASVVSNVVGNVTLADLLVDLPVRSAYSAALIFAGAHLLTTLFVVALHSKRAQWLRSVRAHGALIANRCRKLIRVTAVILWTMFSLSMFGVLGDLTAAGLNLLQFRWKLGAAEISIQDVAVFFAVFLSAVIFSRMLRFVLTEEILPRIRLPRGVPGAVDVLSRYGVLLLGFLMALAAAGVDFSKVTLLISALGVGIGFGLQNLVNNFVSGLILVFEHPVQVGDVVEVGPLSGEVQKIGFRASILRTADGADVIVPNSELIGSRVVNYDRSCAQAAAPTFSFKIWLCHRGRDGNRQDDAPQCAGAGASAVGSHRCD